MSSKRANSVRRQRRRRAYKQAREKALRYAKRKGYHTALRLLSREDLYALILEHRGKRTAPEFGLYLAAMQEMNRKLRHPMV